MNGIDLKIARIKAGLTQWELGVKVSIPSYRLSAAEKDRVQLTVEEQQRLQEALASHEDRAA